MMEIEKIIIATRKIFNKKEEHPITVAGGEENIKIKGVIEKILNLALIVIYV